MSNYFWLLVILSGGIVYVLKKLCILPWSLSPNFFNNNMSSMLSLNPYVGCNSFVDSGFNLSVNNCNDSSGYYPCGVFINVILSCIYNYITNKIYKFMHKQNNTIKFRANKNNTIKFDHILHTNYHFIN